MAESIDKASSGGDMMTWGIMFGLLVVIAIGLAVWTKIEEGKDT